MKKDKIIETIVFILLALFAVSIIFLQKKLQILFFVTGLVLIIVGILYALLKKKTSVLLIGIGASIVTTSMLYVNGIVDFATSVMFFLTLSFDVILFLTIIVMTVNRIIVGKIYEVKQQAFVIDLIKSNETKKEYYMPVYKYTYKTKDYYVESLGYINKNIPNIGDSIDILVSKKSPENVYILPRKKQVFIDYFGMSMLLILGILILISLFG